MTAGWQDALAVLAALAAGAWLFRRWRIRRRTKVGCDTCAASMHARMKADRAPKSP